MAAKERREGEEKRRGEERMRVGKEGRGGEELMRISTLLLIQEERVAAKTFVKNCRHYM